MTIIRLCPSHVTAYRNLMLEAFDKYPNAFTSSVSERAALPLTWWEQRLDEDPHAKEIVLGAMENEVICGVVGLSFSSREKVRHKAQVFGMYVAERKRGEGLASTLLQAALKEASAREGVRLVQLTVTRGNFAAEHLYTKAGFVLFGEEVDAVKVHDGYVTKLHMWKRL